MKVERMILLAFLGNFLVNNVAAALASLVPASQGAKVPYFTAQYITYMLIAAIVVGIMAWWYLVRMPRVGALKEGVIFGIVGFLTAIVTVFIQGIASFVAQTGSLSQLGAVLPNFWNVLVGWPTLITLCFWIIPAVLVGWFMQWRMTSAPVASSMRSSSAL